MGKQSQKQQLVLKHQKFAIAVVIKVMRSMKLPLDFRGDYISAGYLGLVEAADRFDSEREIDFRGFAALRIRGAVIDTIEADSGIPRSIHKKLKIFEANYESYRIAGENTLLAMVPELRQSEATSTLEEEYLHRQEAKKLRALVAALPEKEKTIVCKYYFDDKKFTDIADEGKMSKGWVSRVHDRALRVLRKNYSQDKI